jgi:16S rRNA (cytidine1402-2'-O)-methyltransferase
VLYVVSTPLGDPRDLSPRAIETLAGADVVFAEDTRTAGELLARHGLRKALRSCFDANEAARAAELGALLGAGRSAALVSEAGTPAVSDPGYELVRAAVAAGARVVPVPGPSALLAALVASGLPTARFFFGGFPPRKPGARRRIFEDVRALPATLIFYESPRRVAETLRDLAEALGGDRPACLARELTKPHEELVRGTLAELAARYEAARPLGEVTLVVGGAPDEAGRDAGADDALAARASALLAAGHSARDVAQRLAEETGRPRREVYERVLALTRSRA